MPAAPRPLPAVTPLDRPYWEAARQHELRLQRCLACGHFRFPASPLCPDCGAGPSEWVRVAGRGRILSWVVFHKCYFPAFADQMPYNVALIELEEGPVMVSNVVDVEHGSLRTSLPVEVVFEDITAEVSIPKFRPAGGA